jgi:uncharacterized membrane protein
MPKSSRALCTLALVALSTGASAQITYKKITSVAAPATATHVSQDGSTLCLSVGVVGTGASGTLSLYDVASEAVTSLAPATNDQVTIGDIFFLTGGLSADGSIVVGNHSGQAARWDGSGWTGLGGSSSKAFGVSDDGLVVVGRSGGDAFSWTAGGGLVNLGGLGTAAQAWSVATAASPDGSLVLGCDYPYICGFCLPQATEYASTWPAGPGSIQHLPPGAGYGRNIARNVTPDGTVIIGDGFANILFGGEAWRYEAGTYTMLGSMEIPFDVTDDGDTIVGAGPFHAGSTASTPPKGSIWLVSSGTQDINLYLTGLGVNLGGDSIQWVTGISGDGRVLCGLVQEAGGTQWPFVVEMWPAGGTVTYCTAGTSASGCNAMVSTTGTASASASSGFTLAAAGVEGLKSGLFFFGSNGRQANPWGSSTSSQCVVPPVIRGGLLGASGTAGLCDGAFSQDLNALWCAACPKPLKNPGAGALVQAQLWYRDPFNTSNQTTSLSDAVEFTVDP